MLQQLVSIGFVKEADEFIPLLCDMLEYEVGCALCEP